jgi:hypothetical protein
MSFKRAAFGFALPVSLALACVACGQGNYGQSGNNEAAPAATAPGAATTPMTGSTATMPPPGATAGEAQSAAGMTAPAGAGTSAAAQQFSTIAGTKDYISKDDAAQDTWLNSHFVQCDTDHDGKVTRAEYEACRVQNPPMQSPQPSD